MNTSVCLQRATPDAKLFIESPKPLFPLAIFRSSAAPNTPVYAPLSVGDAVGGLESATRFWSSREEVVT